MRVAATLFEALTLVGALIGGYFLLAGLSPDQTAIQTGASAAVAVAFVAIPYCIAGAFHRGAIREAAHRSLENDGKLLAFHYDMADRDLDEGAQG